MSKSWKLKRPHNKRVAEAKVLSPQKIALKIKLQTRKKLRKKELKFAS